jgi:hypothetical protein
MMAGTRRVALKEAAQILGTSKEAVCKRVSRGTLTSEVGEDGRKYVYLDAGGDGDPEGFDNVQGVDGLDPRDELVTQLRDEVAAWREEARRKDTIIMSLTQANSTLAARVPELEAPSELRESPQTASPRPDKSTGYPDEAGAQEPSWWRKLFGLG